MSHSYLNAKNNGETSTRDQLTLKSEDRDLLSQLIGEKGKHSSCSFSTNQ